MELGTESGLSESVIFLKLIFKKEAGSSGMTLGGQLLLA